MGIIPAYAGNTEQARARSKSGKDHPRVCGEHFSKQVRTVVYVGSSPRMRGTRLPALSHQPRKWDHPRVCGEHELTDEELAAQEGSSPRMRGTLCREWRVAFEPGIIPAYAGNTVIP